MLLLGEDPKSHWHPTPRGYVVQLEFRGDAKGQDSNRRTRSAYLQTRHEKERGGMRGTMCVGHRSTH